MALKVAPAAAELNLKMTNILKIEKLLNDSSYRELIEFSSNFNARLCLERKLRMPFLDPQTQIAQKHSNLYHKKSQRLPGLKEGQIYTYPSPRWRCRKNTNKFSSRPFYRFRATDNCSAMVASSLNVGPPPPSSLSSTMTSVEAVEVNGDLHSPIDAESNSLNGAADTDSKDSQNLRDESMMSKDWFYDDMDANDVASEEQPDSDFEFNLNGYKRKRKPVTTRKSSRKPNSGESSKKSRPSSSASSASRSSRSRKPASKSKAASSKSADRNFADVDRDPPSFADVEPTHFRSGDHIDGAYF